jgi:lipopolysaccharide/colanic/teichoic acid biosynthesis glycosyltransferase
VKRLFDVTLSLVGIVLFIIPCTVVAVLIWLQDLKSPFYISSRVAKGGGTFKMVKFRSMVIRADTSGVDSTTSNDPRITVLGKVVRKFKIDELPQLWNVLKGDMSFVGPRPNVERETCMYTAEEKKLLSVRPGITDFSSIVFSDEGDILEGSEDPDLLYNQIIRPWKSRLGIFYVENNSIFVDVYTILLTLLAAIYKTKTLPKLVRILEKLGCDPVLVEVASRKNKLVAAAPPGSIEMVHERKSETKESVTV